ncbi:IS66 family insertion sequence element accessory protein TnpB [Escherichia coli]|uniref:IS66 family insertion sequence element accessory protein TnpB n=1 Tax=Escherichia coli TaxID=562 RepID=UPI00248212EF|nr:IS66 family insertion sequence element accessory protein TnpB [Escherichia coli]MDI1375826.1 IS66 family insertion sequence element accessory protein TnpB [Escherichia coli]
MLSPHSLWLVREPADIRAGIDSLTRLATQAAGHPPREGEAFLFTGKKRTRMKLCKMASESIAVWHSNRS